MEAAWYPDPLGLYELRYFDGSDWTPHVASEGQMWRNDLTEWFPPPPPDFAARAKPSSQSENVPAPSSPGSPTQAWASRTPRGNESEGHGVFSHTLGGKPISSSRQQFNVILLVFVCLAIFGGFIGFGVLR